MTKLKGLNGVKRNIAKFKLEWDTYGPHHWRLFRKHLRSPLNGHRYVDLDVEAARDIPYTYGHYVSLVLRPLLLASLLLNLYLLW